MIPQSATYNGVDVARIDDVDDGDVQLSSPSPSITSHLQSSSNSPHFAHLRNTALRTGRKIRTLCPRRTLCHSQSKTKADHPRLASDRHNDELVPESAMLEEKTEIFGWRDLQDASETIAAFVRGMEKKHQEKVLRAEEGELWIVSGMF